MRFLRPFYIGSVPVTPGQWRVVMQPDEELKPISRLLVDRASWFDCQELCENSA